MSSSPEELRQFLRDFASSYEELEVLLLLARSSDRAWTAPEIATAGLGATEAIEAVLAVLVDAGLVEALQRDVIHYRYAVADETLNRRVMDLQRVYEGDRLSIVQMMSENALERIRRSAVRQFVEALRLARTKS